MQNEISNEEVVKLLIDFINENLVLENQSKLKKKHKSTSGFERYAIEGYHPHKEKLSETDARYNNKLVYEFIVKDGNAPPIPRTKKRLKKKKNKEKYSGMMLIRSVDKLFNGHYCRSLKFSDEIKKDSFLWDNLKKYFNDFVGSNVKKLRYIETELLLKKGLNQIAYFNPINRNIDVITFENIPRNQIIPLDYSLKDHYFWGPIKNSFRTSGKLSDVFQNQKFKNIQSGAHEIYRIINPEQSYTIDGKFTFKINEKGFCIPISYKN
jgi:hypothetical protein